MRTQITPFSADLHTNKHISAQICVLLRENTKKKRKTQINFKLLKNKTNQHKLSKNEHKYAKMYLKTLKMCSKWGKNSEYEGILLVFY